MASHRQLSFADLEADPTPASTPARDPEPPRTLASSPAPTDRAALAALETALTDALSSADDRPPLVVLSACVEGRGDRAGRDSERIADRRVVEVRLVAQEDSGPLPLGQSGEENTRLSVLLGMAVRLGPLVFHWRDGSPNV